MVKVFLHYFVLIHFFVEDESKKCSWKVMSNSSGTSLGDLVTPSLLLLLHTIQTCNICAAALSKMMN